MFHKFYELSSIYSSNNKYNYELVQIDTINKLFPRNRTVHICFLGTILVTTELFSWGKTTILQISRIVPQWFLEKLKN